MIVYKLTCRRTGLSYVGSTMASLEKRWDKHRKDAKDSKSGALRDALREHPSSWDWERVVLEEHSDALSMIQAERDRILSENTLKPNGYNDELPDVEREAQHRVVAALMAAARLEGYTRHGQAGAAHGPKGADQPTRDGMTAEQLEQARLNGLRGAASRTKEELAEAGRKGAAKAWSDPGHKERVVKAAKEGHKRWWDSLSEEEKERHREEGRRAAKGSASRGGRPRKTAAAPEPGTSTGT